MNYLNPTEQKTLHDMCACLRECGVPEPRIKTLIRKQYKRAAKISCYPDPLDVRLSLRQNLAEFAEKRKVGLAWSSMDCDHSYASGVAVVPDNVMLAVKFEDDLYENAEGRVTLEVTRPVAERYEVRDLALEAFEDGRPHLIRA